MSFAFAYDKALTGEFIIRNRTIYVGGGIVFGSGIKFPSIWPEKGTQKGCHYNSLIILI